MFKILILLTAMTLHSTCHERDTLLEKELTTSITTSTHHLKLKSIDFHHLTGEDLQTYCDHVSSWHYLENQLGFLPAVLAKFLSWFVPNTKIHGLSVQALDDMWSPFPKQVVRHYGWFIFDAACQDKFMGYACLFFYPQAIPNKDPNKHYYNVGLTLIPEYQRQGLATTLLPRFVDYLRGMVNLPIKKLLIRTEATNVGVHKLVSKFPDIKLLGHAIEEKDCILYTSSRLLDFYEIDLASDYPTFSAYDR